MKAQWQKTRAKSATHKIPFSSPGQLAGFSCFHWGFFVNKTQPKLSTTTQEIIYFGNLKTSTNSTQIPLQQQQFFILGQWGLLGRPPL